MEIEYVTGDLFKTNCPLILHGCNAQGRMGSGVAKIVRERFPEAYEQYFNVYRHGTGLHLGHAIFVESNGKHIGNLITQEFYGSDGKRYVSYDAINNSMEHVNHYCSEHGIEEVALPLIGAGLGGGSWKVISSIIEHVLEVKPYVYTLDGQIPE